MSAHDTKVSAILMPESKISAVLIVIIIVLITPGCIRDDETKGPELKVAVLHIGSIENHGWAYEAHLGAQGVAEALPHVELSERKNACGPDAPEIMREYVVLVLNTIFFGFFFMNFLAVQLTGNPLVTF